jgi:hypothetical protein
VKIDAHRLSIEEFLQDGEKSNGDHGRFTLRIQDSERLSKSGAIIHRSIFHRENNRLAITKASDALKQRKKGKTLPLSSAAEDATTGAVSSFGVDSAEGSCYKTCIFPGRANKSPARLVYLSKPLRVKASANAVEYGM